MKGIAFYDSDFFVIKEDKELVSESIVRIISTNMQERVDNPYFGVNLRSFIFEPNDDISKTQIISLISQQITTYEPRVNIVNVTLENEDNYLMIVISFKMKDDDDDKLEIVKIKIESEE